MTQGIFKEGTADPFNYPHSELPFSQMIGPIDGGQGGSIPAYTINSGEYKNKGHDHLTHPTLTDDAGNPVLKASAGKMIGGAYSGGNVFYLGGHSYGTGDLSAINGRRMALNTIFVPADRPTECGLNFDFEPSMTIEKTSTTSSLSAPGTVTYHYLVSNTGNVDITGLLVVDDNVNNDMSCDASTIPVGGSVTCTATHTFTQGELNAGFSPNPAEASCPAGLYNGVAATSNEVALVEDDLCIPISQTPGMTVEKSSVTTSLDAPQTVNYSYLVSNTGNVTLTGIALSDDNDEDDMTCPAASLIPGASMTCTATHDFDLADLDAAQGGTLLCPVPGSDDVVGLYNVVTANANETAEVTDNLCIPVVPNPGMTVEKSSATISVSAPTLITYTYLVSNTGNVTITALVLTDDNIDPSFVDGKVNCPVSSLIPGASTTCTATHNFTQAELDIGHSPDPFNPLCPNGVYNGVVASASEAQATDDLCIPIIRINVVKSVTGVVEIGLNQLDVTYRIDVTNTGGLLAVYDLYDMLLLSNSVAPASITSPLSYIPISDGAVNSGVIENVTAADYGTGVYILTGESIDTGKAEAFEVTLRFTVDTNNITPPEMDCKIEGDETGTGLTNYVEAWVDGNIVSESMVCEPVPREAVSTPTLNQYMLGLLALLLLSLGIKGIRANQRYF